jgi:hypothetical protein
MRLIQSSGISSCGLANAAFRDFSRKIALILVSKGEFEIDTKDDKLWESHFREDGPKIVQSKKWMPSKKTKRPSIFIYS